MLLAIPLLRCLVTSLSSWTTSLSSVYCSATPRQSEGHLERRENNLNQHSWWCKKRGWTWLLLFSLSLSSSWQQHHHHDKELQRQIDLSLSLLFVNRILGWRLYYNVDISWIVIECQMTLELKRRLREDPSSSFFCSSPCSSRSEGTWGLTIILNKQFLETEGLGIKCYWNITTIESTVWRSRHQ